MGELIADIEKYLIYKVNNEMAGDYYLCIPNNNISNCQLYIGLFDSDNSDLTNNEIVSMISDVNDMILMMDKGAIYIVPNIDRSTLDELSLTNDQKFYNRFSNEVISPIVRDVYNMLIHNNIKKNNIIQYIQVITRNDRDKNIFDGFSLCPGTGPFMKEKKYYDLMNEYTKRFGVTVLGAVDNSDSPFVLPIIDTDSNKSNDNLGITPISHDYDSMEQNINFKKGNQKVLVRKTSKKGMNQNGLPGFSSFNLIMTTLFLGLIFGGIIGYMILR